MARERCWVSEEMLKEMLEELEMIGRLRSQFVILKRGQHVKHLPVAFTEHGALMAASQLNSPQAVEMSVFVVRAFVQLRDVVRTHRQLATGLAKLERKVAGQDRELRAIFAALRSLLAPVSRNRRVIGFRAQSKA